MSVRAARARSAEPLAGATALWSHPGYRRMCSTVVISEVGDWLLFIALPLYVLQSSGSALNTATVFLAELLPAVVVGTLSGPLIDRANRAGLLTALTSLQAIILMPLLWVGPGSLWVVYAVAALQAAVTSITRPAQQAMVPLLVTARDLPAANATLEMASNAARLAGSPLGGALLPVVGLQGLVLGDAASFLISAGLLWGCARLTSDPATHEAVTAGRLNQLVEGWNVVRRSRSLRSTLAISLIASIAQGLFLVLFVLFVIRLLHAGDQLVGLLRGVQAIGGVLGGLVITIAARHLRLFPRAQTAWGLLLFGLVSLISWNSPVLTTARAWYLMLFIAVGIPATALGSGLITEAQSVSPPGRLGQVLSLNQVAEALGQGLGILAAGLLSNVITLTALLNVQAGCYLLCAPIALAGFSRRGDRAGPMAVRSGRS